MKLKITITGPKVHEVGYRYFLLGGAMGLRLPGFDANNLLDGENQVVDIAIEGKENQINTFKGFVENNRPADAKVTDIITSDYDGDVMRIAEYSQVLTAMQMLKAIPTILEIRDTTKAIQDNTNCTPKILEITQAIKDNTNCTPKILEEIKGLRDEIQPGISEQLRRVEVDIRAIKDRLGMP